MYNLEVFGNEIICFETKLLLKLIFIINRNGWENLINDIEFLLTIKNAKKRFQLIYTKKSSITKNQLQQRSLSHLKLILVDTNKISDSISQFKFS